MKTWDLDFIAHWMHSRDSDGYVDPATREVYSGADGEVFDHDGDVLEEIPDAWVSIPHSTSHKDFAVMEEFTELVSEPVARARLEEALAGRGPFRRFRDVIFSIDGMGPLWHDLRQARSEQDAASWLIDEELVTPDEAEFLRAEVDAAVVAAERAVMTAADAELVEIEQLERELQTPARRRDARWLEEVLADDFEEVGASGRVWSRAETLRALAVEDDRVIGVRDLVVRRLGADTALVRWTSDSEAGAAERSSLWRKAREGWRLAYHQGTRRPAE